MRAYMLRSRLQYLACIIIDPSIGKNKTVSNYLTGESREENH